eukprot:TRINITY_DN7420_c0_g1_i7.p1 TRINITY_DN7420_c0_g1~~TRINITY_DN7420_c0_g1_i7.p1  ORF type:complete len:601 (+),score=110.00 TRINITY_DN7420_c0_g1_i7:48-1850(+)
MGGAWSRVGRWSCRPNDSEEERAAKMVFAPVVWVIGIVCAVWTVPEYLRVGISYPLISTACVSIVSLTFAAVLRWTDAPALRVCAVFIISTSVLTVAGDLDTAARMAPRTWPWFAVLIVGARLLALDDCVVFSVVAVAYAWVAVEVVDNAHEFGLLRVPMFGQNETVRACDCPDPPCPTGLSWAGSWSIGKLIYIGAVQSLSRTFSVNVTKQLNLVKASVQVTQRVTVALSRYEVDSAALLVNSSEGEKLPPELRESLTVLLSNLNTYKAYLPQSCLMQGAADSDSGCSGRSKASVTDPRPAPGDSESSEPSPKKVASSDVVLPTVVSTKVGPKAKRLSLLCCCREDFLSFVRDAAVPEIESALALDVGIFCSSVTECGGVVDLMSGEHGFASFNASRPCTRHAHKALIAKDGVDQRRSAGGRPMDLVRFAAASGSAICGDFGSTTMQRFMVLGRISSVLLVIEKLSAEWKLHSAVNDAVYDDTRMHWRHTPAGAWFMVKLGPQSMNRVYEVGEQIAVHHEKERMYQLAALETPEDHVAKWLDQVAAGAFDPAEQMLDTHFGRQSVVVVSEIGLTCHRVWRLDAQTCLATSICPSAKEDT